SVMSHYPAAVRHAAPAFPAGCVQVALVPLQVSVVQGLPSSVHPVPLALATSVGQDVPTPSQVSATSHSPAAARQTAPADLTALAGHVTLDPVQFSAASHRSTAARQTVLEGWKPSDGQVVLVPVQVSATSQTPADVRHTAPAFPAGCVHVALVPSHTSVVQGLPSSGHVVPAELRASFGQVAADPVHVSAGSHTPAEARHVVPAVTNVHDDVQQEPDWPFCAPRSHCSPDSTWPSP